MTQVGCPEDAIALPPELAFLIGHGVPPADCLEAARLADLWGVTGDEALIAAGLLAPTDLYRALATETGQTFLPGGFAVHPLAQADKAILSGLAPLDGVHHAEAFAYAPRGAAFAACLRRGSGGSEHLAITTPDALLAAVFAARGEAVAQDAAEGLARIAPQDSFHGSVSVAQIVISLLLVCACIAAPLVAGGVPLVVVTALLGVPFLGLAAIKLAAALEPIPTRLSIPPPRMPDAGLPVYTVLVPLHREERVIARLLAALAALDYPAAKLDVMLLLEAGDEVTASALARHRLPGFVRIVTVPAGLPRTKPRALNVGLSLARGRYLVVYDAEDVPDLDQLRLAVSVFARSAPEVACLQARLVIDNTRDSWLTGFFTVEYGGLFDVVNPALARFDLPIPLGGTSNHLKVDVLRALGGWDAWNVTEDADLAIRLATGGFRVADLPSCTLEEAPSNLRSWMAQRTRWMKGFIQVTITHSRRPIRNLRLLGPVRLFGATALVFGAVASAVVYPVFTALVIAQMWSGTFFAVADWVDFTAVAFALTLVVAGGLAMVLPAFVAIARRRWWSLWPFALLMPFYFLLVSMAAWRGMLELVFDPDRWNKTEHGLARTSRASDGRTIKVGARDPERPAPAPAPR